MYKSINKLQHAFLDFNQPLGLRMNPNNRWIKMKAMNSRSREPIVVKPEKTIWHLQNVKNEAPKRSAKPYESSWDMFIEILATWSNTCQRDMLPHRKK